MTSSPTMLRALAFISLCTVLSVWGSEAPPSVTETARQVPVAAEVDVVVVGGGSGAVAAAASAAKAGAKVFVVAPRTYLGEDMAGTMRVTLEPGEKPATELARRLFVQSDHQLIGDVPFTYETDKPSARTHGDTTPPSMLCDGKWEDASRQSVQFDGDVDVILDLGKPVALKAVHTVVFTGADHVVSSMSVSVSGDKQQWQPAASVKAGNASGETISLSVQLDGSPRYLRCSFRKALKSTRILLGEILVQSTAGASGSKETSATTPMQVKRVFDQALHDAGVQMLYGCYATDLLRDPQGNLAGIVMVNRSGRQAILAKTIIDATQSAVVARLAGAQFQLFTTAPQTVTWVVNTDHAKSGPGLSVRKLAIPVSSGAIDPKKGLVAPLVRKADWIEYSFQLNLSDESWPARAQLDQTVRDLAYDSSQLYTADEPFFVFPQAIKGLKQGGENWPGADKLDLDLLRPANLSRLWVLGPCADLPRDQAAKLLRPVSYMEVGERVGIAAAAEAKAVAASAEVKVSRTKASAPAAAGSTKELLAGLRPFPSGRLVAQEEGALPLLASYDVVVVGGGTSGAPAGIAAARQGAKTLVIEYLDALGGVGTAGMIGTYWYGNRVGFTKDVPQSPTEVRMEWYRSELRKAKADIWFGSLGCGALVEGNRVTGVVVTTPYGRGVVRAKIVVDATGSADVAIAAGASYTFVDFDYALQGSHIPGRNPGHHYANGDIPAVDDTDPINVRQAIQEKLNGASADFDFGQLMDTRERRRIVGDYCLDWLDEINHRTFPDSICCGCSDYDSHGYQIHPFFAVTHVPPKTKFWAYVPYRCLLPKGLEGILVVGLGLSAHRDAMPIVRMQPDLHNIGYAAGVAAAMACREGITPRQLDVKELQRHLVKIGNLEESVLTARDSFPMSVEKIRGAIESVKDDYQSVAVLLAQPQDSIPLLRAAYAKASDPEKVLYAHLLAAMGDPTGLPTLLEAIQANTVQAARKDLGSGGRYGMIRAVGFTRDRRAVPVLIAVAREKETTTSFQLARSVAFALGRIGDPAAASALAELLEKSSAPQRGSVQKLMVACALYRCGDKDGQAKRWLQECIQQADGTHARLAWQILNEPLAGSK